MRKAFLVLALVAGCSKKPEPPAPQPETPEETTETPPPKPLVFQRHDRVHLRCGVLPPDCTDAGYQRDLGVHKITILRLDEEEIDLQWDMKERFEVGKDSQGPLYDEDMLVGRIRMKPWSAARTMVLPIHWQGDGEFPNYALLWLTAGAWTELKSAGRTTWRHDPDEDGAVESKGRLRIQLRVNDALRFVDVVVAESATATYRILDEPDNPLILSVKLKQPQEGKSVTGRTRMTFDYEVLELWLKE